MLKIPKVLVVDDESGVRTLMADVLRMDGFQVLTARDGLEAVQICRSEGGRPDLLVTDVLMPPHMNGLELVKRLRVDTPAMKVLYVSAFAGDPMVSEAINDPHADFLPKPLSPIVLSQRVESILAGMPGAWERDACRQRGTVLLALADTTRRQLIRECLRGSGIWVLEAVHQAEANFIGQWHEGPIHLLLTDLPKVKGQRGQWYLRLQTLRPTMETLFVEEGEGGLHLVPADPRETIPELWIAVRQSLDRVLESHAVNSERFSPNGYGHSAKNESRPASPVSGSTSGNPAAYG